ncbi:unnamed protein product [Umbelopsis vinacea]
MGLLSMCQTFSTRSQRNSHVRLIHSVGTRVQYPEADHPTVVPALDRKYTCRCGKSYSVLAADKFQKHVRQCPLPSTSIERPPANGETTELDLAVNRTEVAATEIPAEMSNVLSAFMSVTDTLLEEDRVSLQPSTRSMSRFFDHMNWPALDKRSNKQQ